MGWFSSHQQPATKSVRLLPWATVEAVRRDWATALAAIDITVEEWLAEPVHYSWLREAGQPTQADIARRYGLPRPKVSEICRFLIYREPPERMKEARNQRYRHTLHQKRQAQQDARMDATLAAD